VSPAEDVSALRSDPFLGGPTNPFLLEKENGSPKEKNDGKRLGRKPIFEYQRKKAIELYKEVGSISAVHKSMKGISHGSVYGIIRGGRNIKPRRVVKYL
jgi:hypothetical protein